MPPRRQGLAARPRASNSTAQQRAAWATGAAMSLEQAVADALADAPNRLTTECPDVTEDSLAS